MIIDAQIRLLRYLINVDDQVPLGIARQMAHGGILTSQHFADYSASRNDFEPTDFSHIFEVGVWHLNTYNAMMSISQLDRYVDEEEMSPYAKQSFRDSVNKIRRVRNIRAAEFEADLSAVIDHYVKHKGIQAVSSYSLAIKAGTSSMLAIENMQRDIAKIAVSGVRGNKLSDRPMTSGQLARQMREEFTTAGRMSTPCGEFGFPTLDAMGGGVFGGEVTAIGGKENSGKSMVVQHIAVHNLRAGKYVVLASRENNDKQVKNRLAAHMAGVSLVKLNTDDLKDFERQKILAAIDELESYEDRMLIVAPAHCANMRMLQGHIETFLPEKPGIVVYDHIGLAESYRYRNMDAGWQIVQEVGREFKNLNLYFDSHGVTPVHLNSKGKKDPTMGTAALQYKSLGDDLDNVMMMYHDAVQPPLPPPPGEKDGIPGYLHMIMTRARNMAAGLELTLNAEFTKVMISEAVDYKYGTSRQVDERYVQQILSAVDEVSAPVEF